MQTNRVAVLAGMGLALALVCARAEAGWLGQRYLWLSTTVTRPGSEVVEDIDDSIWSYGAGVRMPVTGALDVRFSIGRSELEGEMAASEDGTSVSVDETANGIGCGITYRLAPGQKVEPYLSAAMSFVEDDLEIGGTKVAEDDDAGASFGGGVQIAITDGMSLTPAVRYYEIFGEDDISVDVGLDAWVGGCCLLSADLGYDMDSEDASVGVGVGYRF